jgi:hypothetical protein
MYTDRSQAAHKAVTGAGLVEQRMAPVPPNSDLQVNKPEAGWQFRLEMFFTNAVLGYWKYAALALVIVLVAVLVYSLNNSWHQNTMKAGASEIAEVERVLRDDLEAQLDPKIQQLGVRGWDPNSVLMTVQRLPEDQLTTLATTNPGVGQLFQLARGGNVEAFSQIDTILVLMDTPGEATKTRIDAAAKQLEDVAARYNGGASASAALDAAELYRRSGNAEGRKRALTTASAQGQGALHASAELALAGMELDDAATRDAGIARLDALRKDDDPSVAETATIELAAAYVAAEKKDEANNAIADYNQKWPDSKRKSEIERLGQRLKGEGAAPAPTEENPLAPGPSEPTPEGPTAPGQP